MKITIETPAPDQEDEIIIRCAQLDKPLLDMICALKTQRSKLTGFNGTQITILHPKDIFYFEAVDSKVFAYCEKQVYEVRQKLYELEEQLSGTDFIRISKSTIVNLSKVVCLSPAFNGRLEAKLKNGEKIIISRQYVPGLKQALGI